MSQIAVATTIDENGNEHKLRNLTAPQRRALKILAKIAPNYSHPTSASFFADRFWENSKSFQRTSKQGVRGQFMPALAARLLHRLTDMKLVHRTSTEHHQPLWYISSLGLVEVQ